MYLSRFAYFCFLPDVLFLPLFFSSLGALAGGTSFIGHAIASKISRRCTYRYLPGEIEYWRRRAQCWNKIGVSPYAVRRWEVICTVLGVAEFDSILFALPPVHSVARFVFNCTKLDVLCSTGLFLLSVVRRCSRARSLKRTRTHLTISASTATSSRSQVLSFLVPLRPVRQKR